MEAKCKVKAISEILADISADALVTTFQALLCQADGYTRWRIKTFLDHTDTPDLLTLLPPELQATVLGWVDGPSLLKASQVSKTWLRVIRSHSNIWYKKCMNLGVNVEHFKQNEAQGSSSEAEGLAWHIIFANSLRQLRALQYGTAFTEKFIDLQNCKRAVKAVDYQAGYLCTVSEEDYVNIWQLDQNIPIMTFPVDQAVSCIKFHPQDPPLLLCGHFAGILTAWDLHFVSRLKSSGSSSDNAEIPLLKSKMKMHSGPVFCCDLSIDLDLAVSGGADEYIKLWCLSSGLPVQSIASQSHWILKVKLIPDLTYKDKHLIISMTRDDVKKSMWSSSASFPKHPNEKEVAHDNSDLNATQSVSNMGNIDKIDTVLCVKVNESNNNFFTPGLQFSQTFMGLIKQDLDEKYASLLVYDLQTFELVHNVSLNFKVKKLIALGNRFALLLTIGQYLYCSTLIVVDIVTGKTVGTHTVPHSKMTTPDGAQLVVGDTDWLDGITGSPLLDIGEPIGSAQTSILSSCSNALADNDNIFQPPPQLDPVHANAFKSKRPSSDGKGNSLGGASSQGRKSLCSRKLRDKLVLAAGIQNEPGRLFTLWWATAASMAAKFKEE
ncbi:uncharacterized protein LOC143027004 isoform X2 [Oratosquilla oratoria]